MLRRLFLLALSAALVAGGCSEADGAASEETASTTSTPTTTASSTTSTAAPTTTTLPLEGHGPYGVTTTMVSDKTTPDIWVYAPDSAGSWPVVYAIPGDGGDARRDLDVMATELARRGYVVFATDWDPTGSVESFEWQHECGYRFSREKAAEFGGDLDQPVTMVGFSAGTTAVLYHALGESEWGPDGRWSPSVAFAVDGDECFSGAPRPDVLVGIAGCHTTNGFPSAVKAWENTDADYVFVTGSDDEICDTAQSETAASYLRRNGYDVTVIEIPDASHGELVFHDLNNDWAELPPDDPRGQQTVRIIIDTIDAAQP